jgi:hypothetical protein
MSESSYELAFKELSSQTADVRPSDVVVFSEPLRSALNYAIRIGRFTLTDFSAKLGFTRPQAQKLADILVARHLFVVKPDPSKPAEIFYEARLSALAHAPVRKSVDVWKKLD